MHVDVHEAETTLSTLINKAKAGEEIIITMGDAAVQLVPKFKYQGEIDSKEPRKLGTVPGIVIAEDFDEFGDELAEMFGMKDQ